MCFVIAGLQPKTKTLDVPPVLCPECGLRQAYTQRIDHYISLFFIPLLRVKQGEPFLFCRRCELPFRQEDNRGHEASSSGETTHMCSQCKRKLEASFKYCPFCGQRQ